MRQHLQFCARLTSLPIGYQLQLSVGRIEIPQEAFLAVLKVSGETE
jgi:hypothetical protein